MLSYPYGSSDTAGAIWGVGDGGGLSAPCWDQAHLIIIILSFLGPGLPSASGPRMDRLAISSPGVVNISRLASRLWRSAQREPDPTVAQMTFQQKSDITHRGPQMTFQQKRDITHSEPLNDLSAKIWRHSRGGHEWPFSKNVTPLTGGPEWPFRCLDNWNHDHETIVLPSWWYHEDEDGVALKRWWPVCGL